MPRHSRSPCPPLAADWGAAERGWGSQSHATDIILSASSMTNTGSFLKDAKGSGKEGRETPTTPPCLRKWRRGRRRLRTGKPSTRGVVPMAKPPRLWKYGVPRVVGEQRTQRTRKRSTRVFFSWMPATGHQTRVKSCGCRRHGNRCFMVSHGDRPKVLSRMR